ncbi:hypothetical protein IGB42_01844 [Andreprevotia sp. IGB-42]|uniref:hypothetical protein n=1 Tax=Andreprevotia sp. IGB-42 TaxID=2497473 RepID=UPI00135AB446|nr:hypothetical protein [Andreprevotia sp. IGB-42]KAF0813493.1 hypothetical protein IGB42_01844 [Andreprevotia sp. IGB-42]
MPIEPLLQQIATIPWFTNLGHAEGCEPYVPITDLAQWQQFIRAANAAEFGLAHDAGVALAYPFAGMSWLPTTHDEADPIHGDALLAVAKSTGQEPGFKAAKLAAFKVAGTSQRNAQLHPALKSGATNLAETACMGGRHACRMAAAEAFLGQEGFWYRVVQCYANGHWPLGLLPGNRVLVL